MKKILQEGEGFRRAGTALSHLQLRTIAYHEAILEPHGAESLPLPTWKVR